MNNNNTQYSKGTLNIGTFPITIPKQPSIFTLELTTLCNNKCSGCANVEVPASRQSNVAKHSSYMIEWRSVIDKIVAQKKANCIIRLSGGEPTLHPQFLDIVKYIDSLNIPHALLTTGKWKKIGSQNLINLYKNCKNAVGFLISLHGADAETHNTFVQSNVQGFKETIDNITAASSNGITVFTNTVITNRNVNQIKEIVQLSKSLGAKYTIFNRFLSENHILLPTDKQLLNAINTVEELRHQGYACRIGNSIPSCFYPLTNYPSVSGYELCHINPHGDIRPDNLTSVSFGNILFESLPQIWASPISNLYRQSVPTDCIQCAAFNSCRGGAKSLYFLSSKPQDKLMQGTLSLEQTLKINDDKDKKNIQFRALTSE